MRQILEAFKYIHEKKIIHKDIQLDNILLNYENETDKNNFDLMKATIKIIDFGLACKISLSDIKEETPNDYRVDPYNIISSINKKKLIYREKNDIWFIGSLCYNMLIGKPLFDGEDLDTISKNIQKGKYSVPNTLSQEAISFLDKILRYYPSNALTTSEFLKHPFLFKNTKDFQKVNLKTIPYQIKDDKIILNIFSYKSTLNKYETIWPGSI